MEENFLTWNVTNWITVVLMAVLGIAILMFLAQGGRMALGRANAGRATTAGGIANAPDLSIVL